MILRKKLMTNIRDGWNKDFSLDKNEVILESGMENLVWNCGILVHQLLTFLLLH